MRSKHNGILLANSYLESPYQYKQVLEPGDENATHPVPKRYRLQYDNELDENEQKQGEADDQAIHILLMVLPPDVYVAVDSLELVTMKGIVRIDQGSGILHATQMVNPTLSNKNTALVYDTVGISEVPNFDHYYDNEMYNLFTHEEQHPNLHESTHGTSVE
ncbi:hypothetical protein Tco_0595977 [Tanacetum coccineum]